MLDLDTLRCEFVKLVYYWTGKAQWGIQCDLAYFTTLSTQMYNYIYLVANEDECNFDDEVWDNIRALIEQIQAAGFAEFCNQC
jgi:hypothetical protein